MSLSSSLPEPVENRELCFFLSSFVLYPRDPQTDRGFVELLPLLIGNVRPNSPLSLSLAAVSRCHFHAWELGMRDVETPQVRVAYGKALLATRLALQDPVECSTDETLMAVCLLGFYEVRVYTWKSLRGTWSASSAVHEALRLWKMSLMLSEYRRFI